MTVVDALLAQWERIAQAVPALDLDRACRLGSWTNRELLAHLAVQPVLLARFLETASSDAPEFTVEQNLAGTHSLSEVIDAAARDAARAGNIDFAANVDAVRDRLLTADPEQSVRSLQGWIRLEDYLVTRCVEAVVHGLDFAPAVAPDPAAEAIVADTFLAALAAREPSLVDRARALHHREWIDMATGRTPAPAALQRALPLMR